MLASIPNEVIDRVLKIQKWQLNELTGFEFCSGGCINTGGRLSTLNGDFFIKWNSAEKYPEMFETEEKGLKLLKSTNSLRIPSTFFVDTSSEHSFILMEFIREGSKTYNFWEKLGIGLSDMHRNSSESFGLNHDNYIGSLRQVNAVKTNWVEYFIENRLNVQFKIARDRGTLAGSDVTQFNKFIKKLDKLLPQETPSLLHGDLWSGNLIIDEVGDPCLIDPAIYYGNREVDLAFTHLFGGFGREFYESYNANFPLQPEFDDRIDIYNLYPLLVHVNLFGGGYINQARSIINRFA